MRNEMSSEIEGKKCEPRIKATFLTIERPLLPPPPIDSEPYWCYIKTLIFHDKLGRKVWEQEIPEVDLRWMKGQWGDKFDNYFSAEVFKDWDFGWQLRLKISHDRAKFWLARINEYIEEYHEAHHALKTNTWR